VARNAGVPCFAVIVSIKNPLDDTFTRATIVSVIMTLGLIYADFDLHLRNPCATRTSTRHEMQQPVRGWKFKGCVRR